MLILGRAPEPIDATIFRNAAMAFQTKAMKLIMQKLEKSADVEEGLGYEFGKKAKIDFDPLIVWIQSKDMFQSFMKPYVRQKNPVENLNTALKELVTQAVENDFSETNLHRIIDVCAKTYVNKKAESVFEQEQELKKANKIISDLIDVYQIINDGLQGKVFLQLGQDFLFQARETHADFMKSLKSFLVSTEDSVVVTLADRRAAKPS